MAIEITGKINFDATSVDEATQSVKDLQEEVKETSTTLDKDLKGSFDNVKNSADLLGGSVATVVGGLALLGVENEYIDNLTQGAAGALAFASGINQLGKGVVGFAKNAKVAAAAQRIFNIVLAANPVVLIATAIIGLGAAIAALTFSTKDNTEAEEENAAAREKNLQLVDELRAAERNLARERANSRLELLQLELEDDEKRIERLNNIIAFLQLREEVYGERVTNLINNANVQLQTFETQRLITLEKINKEEARLADEAQKRREKEQKENETEKEKEARLLQERLDNEEAAAEFLRIQSLNKREAELDALERFYEQQEELAGENADLVAQLEEQKELKKTEIRQRFRDEDLEAQRLANEERIRVEAEAAQIIEQAEEELQTARLNAAFASLGLLSSLAGENENLQKGLFLAQKGLALGEVITNAIRTNAELKARVALGVAKLGNPLTAAIGTAEIAAATKGILSNKLNTAASIAAIAGTTFEGLRSGGGANIPSAGGGVGGGVGVSPTSDAATPQFNLFAQDTNNVTGPGAAQNQQQFGGSGNFGNTLRAVVVESDITNTQNRLDLIKSGAEL